MATLVLGSLGTALGGPLGGAIGSLAGRQFDGAVFGSPTRQGTRLKELAVTTSSYGQILPRHFGRMRVAGSVIWATDLVGHDQRQGGGKGSTAVATYSYTASFAIALASRPILGLGRIWADGQLLRGADGTLKVPGVLRIHEGAGDQAADPLIAAAEGPDRCPAYRGIAYVVFEDLDLSEFYNRIPALTFEVIADDGVDLQAIFGEVLETIDAAVPLESLVGYTSEGSPAADLQVFDQIEPMDVAASGETLTIAPARRQDTPLPLGEPAIATGDGDFGAASGFVRNRDAPTEQPPRILRYYDVDRDFQAGVQRASGQPTPGEPGTIELPAALDAGAARSLIEQASRRIDWSRQRLSWRTCELDSRIAPGALVTLPALIGSGLWRVRTWEWRESGVEFSLQRALPQGMAFAPAVSTDPGRINQPSDAAPGETRIVAFELPFDPAVAGPDTPRPCAAVCGTGAGWSGAALYADHGDGQMHALGSSGRMKATVGTVSSALAPANPLLLDRISRLVVTLADPMAQLVSTDMAGLAGGANLALIGTEIVQFLDAAPMGEGQWCIAGFLRGRGGTEHAVGSHDAHEPFALLDHKLVALDAAMLGTASGRQVLAVGRGDSGAVTSPVRLDGITLRPLSPVHARRSMDADGGLTLEWTRRARGGWAWQEGVDVPLVEQAELYVVTLGPTDTPIATWNTAAPSLRIAPAALTQLKTLAPSAILQVRQQGTHALSLPLALGLLP